MKIDLIYQEMLSIINELSDGQNQVVEEIDNWDSFTRLSVMTVESKISEIDYLGNKLAEEDPRFQKMIREIEDLKIFSEIRNKEILKITNVWKTNNKKLASLDELLISHAAKICFNSLAFSIRAFLFLEDSTIIWFLIVLFSV